jgi:hypothetical protein
MQPVDNKPSISTSMHRVFSVFAAPHHMGTLPLWAIVPYLHAPTFQLWNAHGAGGCGKRVELESYYVTLSGWYGLHAWSIINKPERLIIYRAAPVLILAVYIQRSGKYFFQISIRRSNGCEVIVFNKNIQDVGGNKGG